MTSSVSLVWVCPDVQTHFKVVPVRASAEALVPTVHHQYPTGYWWCTARAATLQVFSCDHLFSVLGVNAGQ